jgi:anti-sigma factor RsiW
MMTPERFASLVEAWGADSARWPAEERAAAEAFSAAYPDRAETALAAARELDGLLGRSRAPSPSSRLRRRVEAQAPKTRRAWLGERSRGRPRVPLLLGASWTAAACAGVAAGVLLTGPLLAAAEADVVLLQASLVALDDTEVLG